MMMTAPTLILIGEADEASPVERYREMVAHARPDGAPIALTVYPGVQHNFDVTQLTAGVRDLGNWLDTTSRRPRMRRRRRAHFSPRILAGDLPAKRPQSEEARRGPTVLIAVFAADAYWPGMVQQGSGFEPPVLRGPTPMSACGFQRRSGLCAKVTSSTPGAPALARASR